MNSIPCMLMRGGSSKGLFFLASDLPANSAERDRLLLAAMGSPDLRQIDGMGGGNDLSSKVVIVSPSQRADADVECLFAQVSVARDIVDVLPNSGNMLAGVAPFALQQGLLPTTTPVTKVHIYNRNSGKLVEAVVQSPAGKITYEGSFHLDGVTGTSAPIELNFRDPFGTRTGQFLPTGQAQELIDGIAVSCVDFAIPIVFVKATSVGKSGFESKAELDDDRELLQRLESIRLQAAQRMGLDSIPLDGIPKIALIASPRAGGSICSRYFVPSNCHPVYAGTGALALAGACHTPGTVAEELVELDAVHPERIVIEHPSGQMDCRLVIDGHTDAGVPLVSQASFVTSARPLLSGVVFIPSRALTPSTPPSN